MTATKQNFSMFAGESKEIIVPVTKENNAELDITGSKIKWGFSNILKTDTNGITLSNPTKGEFTITLNPIDTQSLEGIFYHGAVLTDALGNVTTVMTGKITINKSLF
jgi:hypothetical protein